MPPRRAVKARSAKNGKPGLALTSDSPARPLTAYLRKASEATSASPASKIAPNGSIRADNQALANGKSNGTSSGPGSEPLLDKGKGRAIASPIAPLSQTQAKEDASSIWPDPQASIAKDELAIHKKKIAQVEGWLRDALDGKHSVQKYRRLLVLHGPAGVGKSTLVHSLARSDALNFEVIDWSDDAAHGLSGLQQWDEGSRSSGGPSTATIGSDSGVSVHAAARFGSFLSGAGRFSSLSLEGDTQSTPGSAHPSSQTTPSQPESGPSSRRILFLDDLPNVFHAPTRAAFQESLQRHISAWRPSSLPLVVCITDTATRSDEYGGNHAISAWRDRSEEGLSVRNVVPDALREHPAVNLISFNAVAPTILRKGLTNCLKAARLSDAKAIPAPTSAEAKELLEAIVQTCSGDIRSAVQALQFCLTRSAQPGHSASRGTKRKATGTAKITKSKGAPEALLASFSGRESSLAVFHALGKILYNKRIGDAEDDEDEENATLDLAIDTKVANDTVLRGLGASSTDFAITLPAHLYHLDRRKSKVDVETLWRAMSLDASTLQAFQHQNYTAFCDNIDQCADLVGGLSDAESLKPDFEEWAHAGVTQYYSFLISTHSSLLALPSPVTHRKDQRFRGVALFDARRRLRATQEALQEYSEGLVRKGAASHDGDSIDHAGILADSGAERLACEVLPYLSKCRSEKLSPALLNIASMPWSATGSQEGSANGYDDDIDSLVSGSQAIADDAGNQLYDDEGRRLDIQMMRGSGGSASAVDKNKPAAQVVDPAADADILLDDDEIQDSD